jgi:hypothetical protein
MHHEHGAVSLFPTLELPVAGRGVKPAIPTDVGHDRADGAAYCSRTGLDRCTRWIRDTVASLVDAMGLRGVRQIGETASEITWVVTDHEGQRIKQVYPFSIAVVIVSGRNER